MIKSHGEYKRAATEINTVFIFLFFFLKIYSHGINDHKTLHFSKPASRETGTGRVNENIPGYFYTAKVLTGI